MTSRLTAAFWVLLCLAAGAGAAERPAEISLIPWPASVTAQGGSFTLEAQTQIVWEGGEPARTTAHYFGELLERTRGVRPVIVPGTVKDAPKRSVVFALGGSSADPEAYQIDVTSRLALVSAADARGLFNGAVTLWQLASVHSYVAPEVRIPAVRIDDAPRLRWRGLLLDSARQYQTVEFIKRYIDVMALHKLNVLHWHLVDDQAWRLQVPKYPKLTRGLSSYSEADVREVVMHAATRNVMVVPGLEMPGHAKAAVTAYPLLRAADAPGGASSLYNIEEETFAFFDAVFAQVAALFPAPYIHIGADDVPKDPWRQSNSVQARMRELGIVNEAGVQRYFFERIGQLTQKHGRRIVGWDSIFGGGVPDSTIMTAHGLDGALGAVASGHDVIVSSASLLSFDRPQAAPNQYAKAGDFLSLAEVYRFDPAPAALSAQDRSRLIGVHANVWTRTDGNEQEIESLTFPRAAALAEIGWTPPSEQRWADFQQRLVTMMGRYSRLGVRFSDAAFRAMAIKRGESGDRVSIELAKQAPLGEIRYTVNGAEPTGRSTVYMDVLEVPKTTVIKAAVFHNGEPLSRTTSIDVRSDFEAGPM
ncbi:family 20 glycosylhydrolase [Steroidobacter sp. S1-65]|uniref:beta-N-acetylhexosaminidase n=1 Tax=Steroidobacter gossypii TaxID=2805490 RepID=A0ABS1X205_9GAMM|nr:family 20 glycosylhydrolase [Steroidobacter gossypii]MBM0107227.1 family 20 glycosylhydrolase [Steroidobacter gossypii]